MGKSKEIKKNIIISGLDLNAGNRGTAALGYGAFSFLKEKGYLTDDIELIKFVFYRNLFRKKSERIKEEILNVQGRVYHRKIVFIRAYEKILYEKFHVFLPFSSFKKYLCNIKCVAAINGGDGFSDIYGTKIFHSRLTEILLAIKAGIPVIILPQTIGPFVEKDNRELAHYILKSASKIYVRDDKYIDELDKLNLAYERSRDLSCYMKPEPVNIDIEENAIGINVSGLAYFNRFTGLEGQFDNYPKLLSIIIGKFQKMKVPVYLIPHSYIANNPLASGDDMLACKEVYEATTDKTGLYWVDKDLKSPQVKYVISQMKFFIGTRMHANFAAIYTGVPLYGLGYSYKFEGAFRENGVYDNNVSLINNISAEQCEEIANRVIEYYKKVVL